MRSQAPRSPFQVTQCVAGTASPEQAVFQEALAISQGYLFPFFVGGGLLLTYLTSAFEFLVAAWPRAINAPNLPSRSPALFRILRLLLQDYQLQLTLQLLQFQVF